MSTTDLDQLRKKGYRLTGPRMLIFNTLQSRPLSAEDVWKTLKHEKRQVDLATIYRTLNLFVKSGLVRSIRLSEKRQVFELAQNSHHHHLVCERCGKVTDVTMNEKSLLKNIKVETDFFITRHILEFFGTCRTCKAYVR